MGRKEGSEGSEASRCFISLPRACKEREDVIKIPMHSYAKMIHDKRDMSHQRSLSHMRELELFYIEPLRQNAALLCP